MKFKQRLWNKTSPQYPLEGVEQKPTVLLGESLEGSAQLLLQPGGGVLLLTGTEGVESILFQNAPPASAAGQCTAPKIMKSIKAKTVILAM